MESVMKKKSPRKFVAPSCDDPVALARQAMGAALAKVVAGGDPLQIIEMSQRVISSLSKSNVAPDESTQASLDAWTDDELQTLGMFLKQIYLLKKQVAERLNQPFALEQVFEPAPEPVQVPRSEPPAPETIEEIDEPIVLGPNEVIVDDGEDDV